MCLTVALTAFSALIDPDELARRRLHLRPPTCPNLSLLQDLIFVLKGPFVYYQICQGWADSIDTSNSALVMSLR